MNDRDLKRWLFDKGHFHNPEMPTGVVEDDLDSLSISDIVVKTAIRSAQDFMRADLDQLCLEKHNRLAFVDGDKGPATDLLLELPRCGYPDFPIPGSAMASRQQANWPKTCRGDLTFGLNFQNAPGLSAEDTLKAFIGAVNNWNYALTDLTTTVQRGKSGSDIWAGLGRLSGSTLAWSYLAQNSCRSVLEQRYDSGRNWALNYLSTVASHEIGHAYGLPHNRDGSALMYPSIHSRSLDRRGYPNATDLAQAKGLGYSLSGSSPPSLADLYRPMPHTPIPDPDPDPDPEPPTDDAVFRGEFELFIKGVSAGEFILARKPKV